MARAIVAGIVIIVIGSLVVGYFIWFGRHQSRQENLRAGRPIKGDLSRNTERQLIDKLDDAANMLRSMTATANQLDGDFISTATLAVMNDWLNSYQTLRKELERV